MGQALYRKYRSKSLDDVIGQDHITGVIKNALNKGSFSHAYLFAGPRGVGKTSVARILAHAINDFDYNSEAGQLDVIEIDAASNRGIDEIRDLREKVSTAPVRGKYKVYIIDEVHMLTTPAFNALLKTLEEPPKHVVFILATTEVHKLPATIVSRTQRHNFQPINQSDAVNHLKQIAKQEGIKADQAALELVATHGDGSFRDSISLLDQLSSQDGDINATVVADMLGIPPKKLVDDLLKNLSQGLPSDTVQLLDEMSTQGYHPAMVAKILASRLRQSVLGGDNEAIPTAVALELLEKLIDVPSSGRPAQLLEVILIKSCLKLSVKSPEVNTSTHSDEKTTANPNPNQPADDAVSASSIKKKIKDENAVKPNDADKYAPKSKGPKTPSANIKKVNWVVEEVWPQLLGSIKAHHNTLYGILRMAEPTIENDSLVLNFGYAFHQKRMQEQRYQTIVIDNIKRLTGRAVTLECAHKPGVSPNTNVVETEDTEPELSPNPEKPNEDLKTVSNIFGGGELLES